MVKLLYKIRGFREKTRPFCTVIVPAAGTSRRMGQDKLLLELEGQPVLLRTLRALDSAALVDEIIIATREELLLPIADLCSRSGLVKPVKVIRGGESRAESVLAGALEASEQAQLLAVHDGARPLVTPELVDQVIAMAQRTHAAAPALPVTDTIKVADGSGVVKGTPDRTELFAVQTPQVFQAELLRAALQSAITCGAAITDDCSAVERLGKQVYLMEGDPENIKLTRPLDLVIAGAILKNREERA